MNISEKEEQKNVVYQQVSKIYVENIDINIKTIWRPIYKVIDAPFFEETDIFPQVFYLCKNNLNQPQFLSSDVKTVLKIMTVKQGSYEKVVMIC